MYLLNELFAQALIIDGYFSNINKNQQSPVSLYCIFTILSHFIDFCWNRMVFLHDFTNSLQSIQLVFTEFLRHIVPPIVLKTKSLQIEGTLARCPRKLKRLIHNFLWTSRF